MISGAFVESAFGRLVPTDEDLDALRIGDSWRTQTVNLHHLALASKDSDFATAMHHATWVTADGWPIVTLLQAHGLDASRVTGSAWLRRRLLRDDLRSHRVGLLGGSDESGRRLSERIGPSLVFREHGDKRNWDPGSIATQLDDCGVEILLVAVTPPYGETIAHRIREAGFDGSIMAIGGGLDMALGLQRTAPSWFGTVGLEWAYRLASNPKRLWRRYLLECIPFAARDLGPATLRGRLGKRPQASAQ